MTKFNLSATWAFASSFHMGTGLSGNGLDRTIRFREEFRGRGEDDRGEDEMDGVLRRLCVPEITGDAFKGAVRGAAERIVRWLVNAEGGAMEEAEDNSAPRHPALRRIFAWQSLEGARRSPVPAYRFFQPQYSRGGEMGAAASTAINQERGVALEHTLRVIQHWSADAYFSVTIEGRGGAWDDTSSGDYLDLVLLVAAFTATAHVGGKKNNGLGETIVYDMSMQPIPMPAVNAAALTRLREKLIEEQRLDG